MTLWLMYVVFCRVKKRKEKDNYIMVVIVILLPHVDAIIKKA